MAQLLVYHLSPAKHHRYFNLKATSQKILNMLQLEVIVMFLSLGTKSDFFKLNGMLFLLGRLDLFRLLVKKLAIIHDTAYWRPDIGCDFYQIESTAGGYFKSLVGRDYTDLGAVFIDQPNLRDSDSPINPGSRFVSYTISSVLRLPAA
jgi:hypothetical protein